MTTTLSVIIPTLGRARLFGETFPSVLAQRAPVESVELIVVVDGPDPATAAVVAGASSPFPLRLIEHPSNRGLSAARNSGIRAARGDVVLFLDDDLRCDPGLFVAHLAAHERRASLVTFGPVQVAPEYASSPVIEWARQADGWVDGMAADPRPRWPDHACVDANCAVTRSALVAAGGYLETLSARENVEMGLRLWKANVPFEYVAGARAHHCYEKTSKALVERDAVAYGREEVVLGRLHPEYRSRSVAAHIVDGPRWKRAARVLTARTPRLSETVLRAAYTVARAVPAKASARLGAALLRTRQGVQLHASAVREIGSWRRWRDEFDVRLPVLLYHHVGTRDLGRHRDLTVSPSRFERHVRWLTGRGYTGIRPADWLAWLRDAKPLPRRPILITFDDAYAEIAEHALPVLERYGHSAAIFVPTAHVGGTTFWDGAPVMTADQIREWAARGMEFGAHTRSHPDLRALNDNALQAEIEGSRDDLAEILGAPPISFAYPYGFHDARVLRRTEDAFPLAFSTLPGVNGVRTNPRQILRTVVQSGDLAINLALRASLGKDPIELLRARLQVRTRFRRLVGHLSPG